VTIERPVNNLLSRITQPENVTIDPEKGIDNLSVLLSNEKDKQEILEITQNISMADELVQDEEKVMLKKLRRRFNDKAILLQVI
jgi:hypothetical protein